MRMIRGALAAVLLIGAISASAYPANSAGETSPLPGGYSKEDIAKMEQAIKAGKTISLGDEGQWSVSGTGAGDPDSMLAKFEHLPGGKTAVMVGRKIIAMYREYLDKIEDFAKSIGI